MNQGKNICRQLKAIRKQIADANDIAYTPAECHFEGECLGTCPVCEGEVRYLESQLLHRQSLGRKVAVVGLALGLSSVAACAQCTDNTSVTDTIFGTTSVTDDVVDDSDEDLFGIMTSEFPVFPGGDAALRKYLADNVRQPLQSDMAGRVFVRFTVDSIGNVTNPQVLRHLDELCDAEAVRLVSNMPRWIPAQRRGKPISMSFVVPVVFGK